IVKHLHSPITLQLMEWVLRIVVSKLNLFRCVETGAVPAAPNLKLFIVKGPYVRMDPPALSHEIVRAIAACQTTQRMIGH
ncbi:MAG: hypothetical protein ACM3ZE_08285, partial [Myxococcales bacterium]